MALRAFHFLCEDRRLRHKDGREVKVGETLRLLYGVPELCERGMHASVQILDALRYAPGPVLTVVRVGGMLDVGDDKVAGQWRECLWMEDVFVTLQVFVLDSLDYALSRYPLRQNSEIIRAALDSLRRCATDPTLDYQNVTAALKEATEQVALIEERCRKEGPDPEAPLYEGAILILVANSVRDLADVETVHDIRHIAHNVAEFLAVRASGTPSSNVSDRYQEERLWQNDRLMALLRARHNLRLEDFPNE